MKHKPHISKECNDTSKKYFSDQTLISISSLYFHQVIFRFGANFGTAPLCTIFTILLTLWNSEQKNGLLIKLFCFSSDFDETWWSCSYPCVLQFHQVSSKSDEKQKSFINSLFFCSEFQSASRIVKIVHSAEVNKESGKICHVSFVSKHHTNNRCSL